MSRTAHLRQRPSRGREAIADYSGRSAIVGWRDYARVFADCSTWTSRASWPGQPGGRAAAGLSWRVLLPPALWCCSRGGLVTRAGAPVGREPTRAAILMSSPASLMSSRASAAAVPRTGICPGQSDARYVFAGLRIATRRGSAGPPMCRAGIADYRQPFGVDVRLCG